MHESPQMSIARPDEHPAIADEVLVRRLAAGEASAGDELVQRHCASLLRYLQRLTSSAITAEELHQQTWLSVLEHLDRFSDAAGPGSFKAWLFRIATNKVNDLWRSRGRERKATDGLRLVTDQTHPDASAVPEAGDDHQQLRRALDQLPEAQREVVLMRYYGNMRFVEIAQALGCPLNTALGRMHKAVLKLRTLLEDRG